MEILDDEPVEVKFMHKITRNGVDEIGVMIMRFKNDIIVDCKYVISANMLNDGHIHGDKGRIYIHDFYIKMNVFYMIMMQK